MKDTRRVKPRGSLVKAPDPRLALEELGRQAEQVGLISCLREGCCSFEVIELAVELRQCAIDAMFALYLLVHR